MDNWLDRTEKLIGQVAVEKLQNSVVVVFGLGGVGSYTVEALARSGIGTLVIVDNDCVDITNINRQLIADTTTVGQDKVNVMKDRLLKINPSINVVSHKLFAEKSNINNIIPENCSYVIDCIDTVSSKLDIIEYCYNRNIPIISCMGTGNKLDPLQFEITDIYKTSVCPLAKVMRKELKAKNIQKLKVLYSKEIPIKIGASTPASISFVPSVAGLVIAGEVIRDLIV